ncbi:hypothetical protein [Ferruginivarius sediminum]|uniref:Uncharacterized protein n=1 Tax=Ferruginivarius sediminum TaxID=2661937 RepID=A0A369T4I2_9PROT|nr:hypothetical protein [Ferruginivarius sediminum]RDD60251.1 hypothetical protein DRB17_19030 [Ferruginivarius sediminum]
MVDERDIRAYARGFHARFHEFAVPYARKYAQKLQNCGDTEGAEVWLRVAGMIENGDTMDAAA